MENTHEHKPQVTQGSGSAENIGESREAQKNQDFNLTDAQKQNIASQTGIDKDAVADPEDLGAGSGRDDYAGGFGDGMRYQHTDEPTEIPQRLKDEK